MYEEVEENEYLSLANKHLGFDGILDVLEDLQEDHHIKQLDLSYTLHIDDYFNPRNVEAFLRNVRRYLHANKHLTALDFAGNHAFHYHPHPSNEHVVLYQEEFTKIVNASKITHIDLSDNNMTGYNGRELKGLLNFVKNCMYKRKAFQCRKNHLTSQGFLAISQCLGIHSSLTYLDISDNFGGLDPSGKPTSDGVIVLASSLKHCLHMRTLKIARNYLRDRELELISDAIHDIPTFQDLDFSGNLTNYYGCRGLKMAICSLGVPFGPKTGFREIVLSNNAIGDLGMQEICEAIARSQTLRIVRVAFCQIREEGGEAFQAALAENSTIVIVDIHGNLMSEEQESLILAESEANGYLEDIQHDPLLVNANELSTAMQEALARKLRFLDKKYLIALHDNPSFNEPESELCDSLHFLQPPPRKALLNNVKEVSKSAAKPGKAGLEERLAQSRLLTKRADAAWKIFIRVKRWWKEKKRKQALMEAFLEEQKRAQELAVPQEEDDILSYASSIATRSLGQSVGFTR